MKAKNANRLFLTIIIVHFISIFALLAIGVLDSLGMVSNSLVSEGIIVIPTLFFMIPYCVSCKSGINRIIGFHRIKVSTAFFIVLFMMLLSPLITLVNAVTMLYTDNTVAEMTPEILNVPFPLMLLLIGVFAPVCEEFVFRGIIFHSYRRTQAGIWPVILSALLFGLMHLNLNQSAYAFVIGLGLALLVDATGSIWSSVLFHVVFNSSEVILMYVADSMMPDVFTSSIASNDDMMIMIAVYMVLALISTALAGCVLVRIAKNENREPMLAVSIKGNIKGQAHLVSVPLVISVVICVIYICLLQIIA